VTVPVILLCDDDRLHADALAYGLDELGYLVLLSRSLEEAFAVACRFDLEALVAGARVEDGSTLALPAALGIRRPPFSVLATRIGERIAMPIARRVGYRVQLTKVVEARAVDRLLVLARAKTHEANAR
jgi:ActR/RegA family two-component response regulator